MDPSIDWIGLDGVGLGQDFQGELFGLVWVWKNGPCRSKSGQGYNDNAK